MSVPEQSGKVASAAIDALKGNPLCLAVVLLAIVLSGLSYFRETTGHEDRAKIVSSLIERCTPQARGAPND